jgi:uncharacterized membrane protein YkvA (DUF1232 family)
VNATFREHYSEEGFWTKARAIGRKAGRKVLENALILYALLTDNETPAWAKAGILAALGYFVMPFDAIPDPLPGIGLADDALVLALLLAELKGLATDDIRQRARDMADRLRH